MSEQAIISPPENVRKYTDGKIVFDAYLQEADEINQNKRLYRRNVLDPAMQRISSKISKRSFLAFWVHLSL